MLWILYFVASKQYMSKIFICFLFLGIYSPVNAQQNTNKPKTAMLGSMMGNILDNGSGKALPAVSIRLVPLFPGGLIRSMVSDKNGSFDFEKLPMGYYHLGIDMMGYAKTNIDSIYLHTERPDLNLGDIKLNSSATALNEVVVYAEKPLMEAKDGKLVYNVAESPLSSGSNASEMLKNLPLMNANPDGTLLLRGKEPLILMDEKPVNLTGQQLTDLLESLPANVVEKVEVMQNPPPEYATYPDGVINIITKKGRVGIYQRFNISGGSKGEGSVSGNLNYRSSKLNISSSLGFWAGESRGNGYSHRQNIYADSVNYFYSESQYYNRNRNTYARVQADYDFSKTSNLSLVYQGNLNGFNNHSNALYSNRDSLLDVYKASSRDNGSNGSGYNHGFSGSYQWKGKNPVEKLQVYNGLNLGKNNNNRNFYQQFLLPDFLPTGSDSTQLQLTDNYSSSFYLNLNYNKPLNDTGTIYLSLGTSYNFNSNHNMLNTGFLRKPDQAFIGSDLLSNDFYFRQSVFAARAALVLSMPHHIKLIMGTHAERTANAFEFIRGNAPNANNAYWRLLPNFTIRKEVNDNLNIAMVFRETIRRPGINELNPSIDYGDPFNIRFGNPYIQPSLTDNYDFNLSYVDRDFSINGSLGYNRVKNVFNSIRVLIDSGKTQTTYQNISNQEEYEASMWTGFRVSQKIRVSISGGYNFNKYSEKEKQLYRYSDGGSFYTTVNYTYAPDNLTVIEANNRYNSYANLQGTSRSNLSLSISAYRKFFKKKLVVAISTIDPFGLQKSNSNITGPNFNIDSYSVNNTRNFRLSLSYQLSHVMVKSNLSDKEKQSALDRLNSN